jgi:hypothetical protein
MESYYTSSKPVKGLLKGEVLEENTLLKYNNAPESA